MIPKNFIQAWRAHAPWLYQSQIEQDLVLSRALIALYQQPIIQTSLAFRGGTALNKLYCQPAMRYSEDIDLVQIKDAPIGDVMSSIRAALDPWLGNARWKQTKRSIKLTYRFQSEDQPSIPLRLKIEINTVEPFTVFGFEEKIYQMNNPWFSGETQLTTYGLNELMATKFRALYQRLKGRDLYDLSMALTTLGAEPSKIIEAFQHYNAVHNMPISRAEYEKNLTFKSSDITFISDVEKVLPQHHNWEPDKAFKLIQTHLVEKLHGQPWKGLNEE